MRLFHAGTLLIGSLILCSHAYARPPIEACSLITKAEIETVQGEPVTHVKSSPGQCFFTVATFAKSVSLKLVRSDPASPSARKPRELWNELFHPDRNTEAEPQGKTDQDEEESSPPLAVKELGDEAFWKGNAITGGLYVLKGDAWFRISIGGSEDSSSKIDKAGRLARKALKRL